MIHYFSFNKELFLNYLKEASLYDKIENEKIKKDLETIKDLYLVKNIRVS